MADFARYGATFLAEVASARLVAETLRHRNPVEFGMVQLTTDARLRDARLRDARLELAFPMISLSESRPNQIKLFPNHDLASSRSPEFQLGGAPFEEGEANS